MFGFKKKIKADGIDREIADFLEEADSKYIKAYETRTYSYLKDDFTKDCQIKILQTITASASLRYFSNEKFRTTAWTVVSESDSIGVYMKTVTYDSVHVAGNMNMKVSADYVERWTIMITPDELLVSDVTLVS